MVVRPRVHEHIRNEEGQSLVEFLLLLPLLVSFAVMMIRVNSAIQISIVNEKYAREHALFLAFNSPIYPAKGGTHEKGYDQMVLGVGDKLFQDENGDPTPTTTPYASVQNIARKGRTPASDSTQGASGNIVHVRDTVTLCSQNHRQWDGQPSDNMTFTFCRGNGLAYEQ
jgi:hypothetical protein